MTESGRGFLFLWNTFGSRLHGSWDSTRWEPLAYITNHATLLWFSVYSWISPHFLSPESNCYMSVLTVGSGVALWRWQVGAKDGVVEDVKVRGHTVVTFIVVQNLEASTLLACQRCASCEVAVFDRGGFLTWADLRTAIFRTIGGIFSPKDAGIDFWMFPTVTPPYLRADKALEKEEILNCLCYRSTTKFYWIYR